MRSIKNHECILLTLRFKAHLFTSFSLITLKVINPYTSTNILEGIQKLHNLNRKYANRSEFQGMSEDLILDTSLRGNLISKVIQFNDIK